MKNPVETNNDLHTAAAAAMRKRNIKAQKDEPRKSYLGTLVVFAIICAANVYAEGRQGEADGEIVKLETDGKDAASLRADAAAELAGLCGFYAGLTVGYPDNWVCNGGFPLPGPSEYCVTAVSNPAAAVWEGITCADPVMGPITKLDLGSSKLGGTISTLIGNLVSLTKLSLGSNWLLEGTIPTQIGGLTDLESLNLFGNKLTKSIPTSLGNLMKLTFLYLTTNSLTGSIPSGIWQETKLIRLKLGGNSLTGVIPTAIAQLVNLEYFSLSHTDIHGVIPSEIGQMTKLTKVSVSYSSVSGAVPSTLCNIPGLVAVYFASTKVQCYAECLSTVQNIVDDGSPVPICVPTTAPTANPSVSPSSAPSAPSANPTAKTIVTQKGGKKSKLSKDVKTKGPIMDKKGAVTKKPGAQGGKGKGAGQPGSKPAPNQKHDKLSKVPTGPKANKANKKAKE